MSTDNLIVRDIRVEKSDGEATLTGWCGDFELWYKMPASFSPRASADPFLMAALLPAMHLGRDIVIQGDAPVSPALLENTTLIQQNFMLWNDYFRKHRNCGFQPIAIHAENMAEPVECSGRGSFFSGGVDGLHTFLRQPEKIDMLIYVQGIDNQLENPIGDVVFDKLREFLDTYNKPLVEVRSNVRFLGHHYGLSWLQFCSGAGLSSIAAALGLSIGYIAASNGNDDVVPEGSNAITDPLWSNGATRIRYDGAERTRVGRIRYIFEADPRVSEILRVCWQDEGYNCGVCSKCLRTMLTLQLLDLEASTLPKLTSDGIHRIVKSKYYVEDDLIFLKENLRLARDKGDRQIERTLLKPIRRFYLKKLAKDAIALIKNDF